MDSDKTLELLFDAGHKRYVEVRGMQRQEREAGNERLAYGWECRAAGIQEMMAIVQNLVESERLAGQSLTQEKKS